MTITLSNPRLAAEFSDWPLGGNKRGKCVFQVHKEKKGTRISRTTTGKPKYTTFGKDAAICDGSDGKTYILQMTGSGFICIRDSAFFSANNINGGSVFPQDELFAELTALIAQANDQTDQPAPLTMNLDESLTLIDPDDELLSRPE